MIFHYQNIFDVSNISDFLAIWLEQDLIQGEEKQVFDRYYTSYKKHFGEYIKFHYNQQTKELMKILNKFNQPLCLEIGCGCGTESLWMAYKGNAIVKGIDIKEERLSVAIKRKRILEEISNKPLSCSFENRSLFDLDEKTKFDVIWMEQTLHHLEPRDLAFDKITKLLKKGGFIVISETNAWNLLIQIRLLLSRGFSTKKELVDGSGRKHLYGDERILTARIICKELEKRQIKKRAVRYFRLLPNKTWSIRYFNIERRAPRWLLPIYTHYNYVGKLEKSDG